MDNNTETNNPGQTTQPEYNNQSSQSYSNVIPGTTINGSQNFSPEYTNRLPIDNYPGYNPAANFNYNQNGFAQPVNLESLAGWMKFLGIFTIVIGALTCIGIITAAIGVPMIFAGVGLVNASKSLREYKDFNNQFTLNQFFGFLNKFFKIKGILAIVYIVFTVLYIAFLIIALIIGIYSYSN